MTGSSPARPALVAALVAAVSVLGLGALLDDPDPAGPEITDDPGDTAPGGPTTDPTDATSPDTDPPDTREPDATAPDETAPDDDDKDDPGDDDPADDDPADVDEDDDDDDDDEKPPEQPRTTT